MKTRIAYGLIIVCGLWIGLSGMNAGAAEELQFPTTEEEIVKALKLPPSASKKPMRAKGALKTKGLDPSFFGKTRGIQKIADDDVAFIPENVIEEAPKALALILFDYDSAVIKEESLALLREYGKALRGDLKEAVVVVAGHTDHDGSDEYNLMLSQHRAEAVKAFLCQEFQIEDRRLVVKPYGENKPIDTNATADGRAKNRRVEFIRVQ